MFASKGEATVDEDGLLEALLALALDEGLEVRRSSRRPLDGEPPLVSNACRLRGDVWVILSSADPLRIQIDVLAEALRGHAGERLGARYLTPAVRACLAADEFAS